MPSKSKHPPTPGTASLPAWKGKTLWAPIPPTRDPFVNTPLLALTPDPETGADRFWCSTWNGCSGSLAALVDDRGNSRIYRFNNWRLPGFYSAAQEDDQTLWLCGWLSEVVRFDLRTGRHEVFATGAPKCLVFQGMALDKPTGKLFAAAFNPPDFKGFVFDFRGRRPVKVLDLDFPGHYTRASFPNPDGTWSIATHLPGEHLLIWDPRTDRVEGHTLRPQRDAHATDGTVYRIIQDDAGRAYIPRLGWYDPTTRTIDAGGPRPERELTWFARRGTQAWGLDGQINSNTIALWDMTTGQVRNLCSIANVSLHPVNLTRSDKIVAVSLYGEFSCFDAQTGALEFSRHLESDAIGSIDCILRIDSDRILGTPFITQRFWESNLKTHHGQDCGRAAPGSGEVLRTWKVKDRVYMAAYTGGELMEYDPDAPARFPENPRVVADPPGGMRPVASADDARFIFYSCSHHYGHLGSVLTRYDTRTGTVLYRDDVLPRQQITTLRYERTTRTLLAGTTIHSDCQSCPPTEKSAVVARLAAADLSVVESFAMPEGIEGVDITGPMGAGRWLGIAHRADGPAGWWVIDPKNFIAPAADAFTALPPETQEVIYAGSLGRFILKLDYRLEIWDFRGKAPHPVKLLHRRDLGICHVFVQDQSVLIGFPERVDVLENCLKSL